MNITTANNEHGKQCPWCGEANATFATWISWTRHQVWIDLCQRHHVEANRKNAIRRGMEVTV